MPPQQNHLQQPQQQQLIMNSTGIMTDREHHFNRSTRPLLERNNEYQQHHHFISDITAPRRMIGPSTKPPITTIKNYDNYFSIQQPQNVQLLTRKKINVVQNDGSNNNSNGFVSPSTFYNSNTNNNNNNNNSNSNKNKTPSPSSRPPTPLCGHNDFDIIKKQYNDHQSSHFGFPYGSVLQTKQSDFQFSDNTGGGGGGGGTIDLPADDYDIDNVDYDDDDSGINVSNNNNNNTNNNNRNFFQRQNSSSIKNNNNNNNNSSKNNNDFLKWKGSSSLKKSTTTTPSPIDSLQQSPVFMTTKQLSPTHFSSPTNSQPIAQHAPPPPPPPLSMSSQKLQNHSMNTIENTMGPFIFGVHSNATANNYFKLKHPNHNNHLRNDQHINKNAHVNDEEIVVNHERDNNDLIAGDHRGKVDEDDDDYDEINENTVIRLKNKYSKYNRRNKCDEKLTQCSVISKRNEKRLLKKTRKKEKIDKNKNNPKGIIKCVLVGDGAIGKTNLICSYLENRFIKEHVPTASDIYKFEVTVNGAPVQVTLCDTAGQDTLDPLRELSYPDSNVFLLCFSIAQPETFQSIKLKWEPKFRKSYASIILVGTQSDLRNDPQVISKLNKYGEKPITTDDAWTFANKIGVKYLETSSLFNIGVKETFDTAIWDALVNFEEVTSKTDGVTARSLWKKLFCL